MCQNWTIVIVFLLACLKHILNAFRQHKMQQLELLQNVKTDHIKPILRQLHWLPVHDRTHHKVLSATYLSVHGNAPLYLSELLHFYTSSRPVRSASRSLLDVPRPRDSKLKRYGQRAFRYVAPSLWNALPGGIRESDFIQSFKASLKTHFFNCN